MLFIATPLYENKVSTEYLDGLMKVTNMLNANGMALEYAFERSTLIAVNREKLVRRFLKTDCQFFMFIDSDIAFKPLDVFSLLSTNVDVVSGLYRYRTEVPPGVCNHCFHDTNGVQIDIDNCAEVQECGFVPTGMLLVKRHVFERLYRTHKFIFNQGFKDEPAFDIALSKGAKDSECEVFPFFEAEDIHFSKLWRETGGKLYVKTSVRVDHIGEKCWKI